MYTFIGPIGNRVYLLATREDVPEIRDTFKNLGKVFSSIPADSEAYIDFFESDLEANYINRQLNK